MVTHSEFYDQSHHHKTTLVVIDGHVTAEATLDTLLHLILKEVILTYRKTGI